MEADEVDYVVDALSDADTEVTLNTTDEITVTVVKYPSNPYPDVPLPENSLPTVVDVAVSDPDAITWPIYVKRYYTDAEVVGLSGVQPCHLLLHGRCLAQVQEHGCER